MPHLLLMEGNTPEGRALCRAAGGEAPSEAYRRLLLQLLPGATVDICYPADGGAGLPDGTALQAYDGVVITGSSLHVYDDSPAVARQIDLARAVLASGTPMFGSCWGLQIIATAAGGSVRKNPKGREIGFSRHIGLTAAGRDHPMYQHKPTIFDAITVHLDEVGTLAPGMQVLASNTMSQVQAAEIRVNGTTAWGVQYHPEYSLGDIAATMRRYGKRMIEYGFFPNEADLLHYAHDLDLLDGDPHNEPLARRHGLDSTVLDKPEREREIANWITHQVRPVQSRRGRG